ncbi:GT4 family glycosyltransferase PelF [Ornithinimicrobium sp. LYQ103]|uniref:GT4 family glycosyltransferase PelF n=1 Tax=Ornithinimicrobium sp. LYQ103 TaxID=3378796 RepID=UPI0038533D24
MTPLPATPTGGDTLPADEPLRVTLVSEGTYPFAMGGVSVWCDQLMRGLPDHRFEFIALTVDGHDRPLWEAPANLERVRSLALWTPERAPRGRPHPANQRAVSDLAAQLVRPLPDDSQAAATGVAAFLDALHRTAVAARTRGTTAGLFTDDPAVQAITSHWCEATGAGMTLRDALDWGGLLEHLLRPLQERPVEADVVHAAMNGPSMLVGMAAHWEHGTPVVLSEHGIYLRERYLLEDDQPFSRAVRFLRLNFFRLLAAASYQVAAAIAPHSRYNRRWQLRCGADPDRMHTMYNGVCLDDFPVAASEPDVPTVCFLGRIDPVKDVRTLIKAFAAVQRTLPQALLRIFGAAPAGQEDYLEGCRALAEELGMGHAVTFEGPTRQPFDAYHSGSVVALSSISEGFPYSIVEAMACGRPVVCTNVGGVAEAVGDGGLVVPPQDPEALGRALVRVLQDDDLRAQMGRVARLRVRDQFTVDRWTGAYGDLYAQVTGRAGSSAPALDAELGEEVLVQ